MKFLLALLALTPLVCCATLTHEEQLIIQSMKNDQKRALFPFHIPSLHDVEVALCKVMNADAYHGSCFGMCPLALASIPYGELAEPLCSTACDRVSSIHSFTYCDSINM